MRPYNLARHEYHERFNLVAGPTSYLLYKTKENNEKDSFYVKLLQEFILLESDAEPETLVLNFGLGAILCVIFNSRINKE